MIIKSMSRKAPTFTQLANYIAKGGTGGQSFMRNLYANGSDLNAVTRQFVENHRYLPELKGGNALYHEVIVLEPQSHLSKDVVEAALSALAEEYCQRRAPHQLAWGRVHHDTEFPHIHLMISANAVRSERRVRLDRASFAKVQRDLEVWREGNLPELRSRAVYCKDRTRDKPKLSRGEGEMIRRTKAPSRKQAVYRCFKQGLTFTSSMSELEAYLSKNGFRLYQRGRSWGLEHCETGRRFRLQTLGLAEAFAAFQARDVQAQRPIRSEPKTQKHASAGDTRASDLMQGRIEAAARDELDGFERE